MENVCIRDDRDTGVRYIKLQKIMETFMIQGDIFWLQKAKMFWYRERDKNTSYFHATVLVRKMRNRVKCLLCEDGVQIKDQKGMCQVAKHYFEDLFKERTVEVHPMLNIIDPCILDKDDNMFIMAFEME